jgi:hypothetical protein
MGKQCFHGPSPGPAPEPALQPPQDRPPNREGGVAPESSSATGPDGARHPLGDNRERGLDPEHARL